MIGQCHSYLECTYWLLLFRVGGNWRVIDEVSVNSGFINIVNQRNNTYQDQASQSSIYTRVSDVVLVHRHYITQTVLLSEGICPLEIVHWNIWTSCIMLKIHKCHLNRVDMMHGNILPVSAQGSSTHWIVMMHCIRESHSSASETVEKPLGSSPKSLLQGLKYQETSHS